MFETESANTIVQLFAVKGHAIMLSHPWLEDNTYQDFGLVYSNLLIDDLGTETPGSHFGNQVNVIGELLQIRYNDRNRHVTHATSNLDAKALKSKYGERVYSRINEMFNYIHMNGNDRRL